MNQFTTIKQILKEKPKKKSITKQKKKRGRPYKSYKYGLSIQDYKKLQGRLNALRYFENLLIDRIIKDINKLKQVQGVLKKE